MKRLESSDAKLREELRVAQEAKAKAVAEKQAEMNQLIVELQEKVEEAKAMVADQKKISDAADLKSKTTKVHLAKVLHDLSAEKASRKKAEAALDSSGKLRKAAEEAAAAANRKAEEAEASVQARVESALTDFQESDAFWDQIMASYDQGLYHMARCLWRAAEQGKTPTLEDLAGYTQENAFVEELVRYHPVIPFSEAEMSEYNGNRRKKGLPELEFPAVVTPNMRAFQQELEQKKAEAEKAAAQAEEATAQQSGA